MKAKVRAVGAQSTPKGRKRAGLLAVGGALVLAAVAACGTSSGSGGTSSGSGSQDGFKQAAQTGGALTVWVDSTRLAAAKLYQKQNPNVKMNIVTFDGD
ncbi:MAG TPA: carbohydrate ABC transporter substrate-binding protein, partial [Actinocrinis sp.]|nr:carbohydrate ABC transporter substrate-binding protein [Actinocrinis sp.]